MLVSVPSEFKEAHNVDLAALIEQNLADHRRKEWREEQKAQAQQRNMPKSSIVESTQLGDKQ